MVRVPLTLRIALFSAWRFSIVRRRKIRLQRRFSLRDGAMPSAGGAGGTKFARDGGGRSEPEPVGPCAGWLTEAERAGAPRPLHGASPAPFPRSVTISGLAPRPRATPSLRREMRRGGSRREPALSPHTGATPAAPRDYVFSSLGRQKRKTDTLDATQNTPRHGAQASPCSFGFLASANVGCGPTASLS